MKKLTPLDIFKLLPKKNCKECGYPTCLSFAMNLINSKVTIDKCPYLSDENREKLVSFFSKSVQEIIIKGRKIGGQEVLFRHEKTFFNPPVVVLKDNIKKEYERAGSIYKTEGIFLKGVDKTDLIWIYPVENDDKQLVDRADIYYFKDLNIIKRYLSLLKDKYIAIKINNLKQLKEKVQFFKDLGIDKLIVAFEVDANNFFQVYKDIIYMRHEAILNRVSLYKYPVMVISKIKDLFLEASVLYLLSAKYVNIIVVNNIDDAFLFNLLLLIDSIYTDPRMPLQVKEDIYKILNPDKTSPFYITTNFSLTFNLVKSEVQSTKVASYIFAIDTGGLSVLNAWAAGKISAQIIDEKLKEFNVDKFKTDKQIIIPGHLANFKDKLEQLGWNVLVGPKEASSISKFLKNIKKG